MSNDLPPVLDPGFFHGDASFFEEHYKQCSQCGKHKLIVSEFSPHNSRPCGYQAACKSCRSDYARSRSVVNIMKKGTPR